MSLSLVTHPSVSCEEASAHEAVLLAGDDQKTERAMRNAGEAVGRAILQDYREIGDLPEVPRLLILAGNGFNAGDAFHAARVVLAVRGNAVVRVVLAGPREKLKPLTVAALNELESIAKDFHLQSYSGASDLQHLLQMPWTLLIDGLLGMSFKPPLRDSYRELIGWANQDALAVELRAAIDLPSGLGDQNAEAVLRADFSYATAVLKAPLLDPSALQWTGRLRWIGVPEIPPPQADAARQVVLPTSLRALRQLRSSESDKRSYGHVLILAGSTNMPGAAILATRAALRGGAGLVTTLMPQPVCSHAAAVVPEAMWQPVPVAADGALEADTSRVLQRLATRADALLIGPGLRNDRASSLVLYRIIRDCPLPLVIDASALQMDALSAVVSRPRDSGPVVITPHWGEFKRLRSRPLDGFDAEDFRSFCRKYGLVTVLKGAITRISDGRTVLDLPSGGPILARGGSGDLLAGLLASCLAVYPQKPLQAAALATLWHGCAADRWAREQGQLAVHTGALLDFLGPVLRDGSLA